VYDHVDHAADRDDYAKSSIVSSNMKSIAPTATLRPVHFISNTEVSRT